METSHGHATREAPDDAPGEGAGRHRLSLWAKLLRDRRSLFGFCVLALMLAMSLAAPWIRPFDPAEQRLLLRLRGPLVQAEPGLRCWLGTDQVGRDNLSRIIYGGRISLFVGVAAVVVGGTVGILLGLFSGYFGGRLDSLIMRTADVQLSFPFILLAITIIGAFGPGIFKLVIVLAISGWVVYARTVRGAVLSVKEEQFVEAAVALGAMDWRIVLRHLLPNVVSPVIVIATTQTATMILLESALSFLGMGVPAPTPSWGRMLSDGREYLSTAWWIATFPGLAIFVTVLGINLLGDGLNDAILSRRR
jgi:peptide/nickel transport system permease protein